jgi:two-component system, response regulator PhcR
MAHPTDVPLPLVLYVDDEPQACKWFARSFEDEFGVLTATGAQAALELLRQQPDDFGVLVTDYRMPGRTGLDLLKAVRAEFPHLISMLATAYAEKEVAIEAVNLGQVFRIVEKPIDLDQMRLLLREAAGLYRQRAHERAMSANRAAAVRETLGFLAHELNTPLATVLGCMTALKDRYIEPEPPQADVRFQQWTPGEIRKVLHLAERSANYCRSLMDTFVQSARDAYAAHEAQPFVSAGALVQALVDEFPFEGDQRQWVHTRVDLDFQLPGRRNLVYVVVCTVVKNALRALAGVPQPRLEIQACSVMHEGRERPALRIADNGPGMPAEVLAKAGKEPVTTAPDGNGMGLVFSRRVLESMQGSILFASAPGRGTTVTLLFKPLHP